MIINGVTIEDTFAEAFTMRVARIVITVKTARWAREAALKLTGFATSVIGCKCEAGIERELAESETPDGRPGVSVLFLTMDKESLPEQLIVRLGQTVLTCPTTACFDGLPAAPDRLAVGKALRVFADGFQGSKVGSQRYKNMLATTNEAFSPTLRAVAPSALPEGVNSVLEIVLDGTDAPSIEAAMRVGIRAACLGGVRSISAGNYGGKLGPHHFPLRKIMTASAVA